MTTIHRSIPLAILFFIQTMCMFGQPEPQYTLYRHNMGFFNPAVVGINDQVEFKVNYRSQFVGIEDAPETQSFYLGIPANNKIGVGLTAMVDKVFIERTAALFAGFSYTIQLGPNYNTPTDLHFGIQGGGSFGNTDFSKIQQPEDPLFSRNVNGFQPNVGAGLLLEHRDYYASLSIPRLLTTDRIVYQDEIVSTANNSLRTYVGVGGFFSLNDRTMFTPSSLVQFSSTDTTVDLTGTLKFVDRYHTFLESFEIGLNYRVNRAFGGLFYLQIRNWLELGYAYEAVSGDLGHFEKGTHEMGLAFKL